MLVAIGGFADLELYGDPDRQSRAYADRVRTSTARIVAIYGCDECGAAPGQSCTRPTVRGRVERRLPHLTRGSDRPSRYPPRLPRSVLPAAEGIAAAPSQEDAGSATGGAVSKREQIIRAYRALLERNAGIRPTQWAALIATRLGVNKGAVYRAIWSMPRQAARS